VSHVFAGHLHYNVEEQADRIKMVTTGPVGKPLGGAQSGVRIVKFGGGALEHRYYTLEELPEKIA
jgi:predicted phosphodiesterase